MFEWRRSSAWLFFAVALVAPATLAAPSAEELEYARKKLAVYREYPVTLARLRQNADLLDRLPSERQTQLRQLDQDLHQQSSAVQARLHDTLDRFNEWIGRLEEKDRERLRRAPDRAARLELLRELRQEEWVRQQPRVFREQVAKLEGPARATRIAKARQDERRRHAEWAVARRFWDDMAKNKPLPTRLDDFEIPVQTYVREVLLRLLSKEEHERLARAEGQWPLYPQTLVELADRHPPALPSPDAPRSIAELPKAVRDTLIKKGGPLKGLALEKKLRNWEGQFPNFAIQLTTSISASGITLPLEWWVFNFQGLSPAMQEFLKEQLEPVLDRKEALMLIRDEGKWPEYPEMIQKLAQVHHMQVPWFSLPGSRDRWDAYRASQAPTVPGFPELPKYTLRKFVHFDLDDLERIKFKNEIERTRGRGDAEAWTYLIKLYFQHYPSELTRLRAVDSAKIELKGR